MRLSHVIEAAVVAVGISATAWWIVQSRRVAPAVPIETAARPSPPKVPDLSTDDALLEDLRVNHLAVAETRWREANLAETSPERQLKLYREIAALDEGFVEKSEPLFDKPEYQAAEYEWLVRGVETSCMRLRLVRDRLRSAGPPVPAPK